MNLKIVGCPGGCIRNKSLPGFTTITQDRRNVRCGAAFYLRVTRVAAGNG
jgi:hypothetical protein